VLTTLESAHIKVLLAGITLPPTMARNTSIPSIASLATWQPSTTSPLSDDLQDLVHVLAQFNQTASIHRQRLRDHRQHPAPVLKPLLHK